MKTTALLFAAMTLPCAAAIITVPNGYENTPGPLDVAAVINSEFAHFEQYIIGSSQLASIPIGSTISAVGFRLRAGQAAYPATTQTFPFFEAYFGESTVEPGPAMSQFWPGHFGGRIVTIAAGTPMTFTQGHFGSSSTLATFGFIQFPAPFVYQGGPLMFFIRHSSSDARSGFPIWDAVESQAGVIGSVHNFNATADTGLISSIVAVMALDYEPAAVPEPGTWAVTGAGLALMMAGRVRQRRG